MIRLIVQLIIISLICSSAAAQTNDLASSASLDEYMETGAEIAGIRWPYYDDEGNLQAQLYIGVVRKMEGTRADVSDMRIDVYDDGEVSMTMYAPRCITWFEETADGNILFVESEGDVLIEMEQMTICGRGFRFSSSGNRFEILSEARVLVKESARNAERLSL